MSRHLFLLLLIHSALPAATVLTVVGKASAPVNSVLSDGEKFTTGKSSKSDVALPKGFFRVGSETGVQVVTSNNLSLEKGIMLAGSTPARFLRPTVQVNAPGYKLQIKGTAQIAYFPGSYVKITVLEGTVQVALQSLTGEWEVLKPGQMLIISPADKRLPEPVEVDIGRLAGTSQLIGGAFAELSTQSLIDSAAAAQSGAFHDGQLAQTPFRLFGASPEMNLANDLDDPNASVAEKPYANGLSYSLLPTTEDAEDLTITRTGAKTQKLTVNLTSAVDEFGQYDGVAAIKGRIRADPDVFTGSAKTLEFQSTEPDISGPHDYNLYVRPGTDIETPSTVALNIVGDFGLDVQGTRLQAGSGTHTDESLLLTARSRALSIANSTVKGHDVTLTGSTHRPAETEQDITADSTQITAQRNVTIGLAEKRTAITLRNTTQLSALVGAITVQSKGGPISIDASRLTAATTITLDATQTGSLVTLKDATLSADVIRARGYSASDDSLIIDGSHFAATTLIQLYAEGVSALRFRNNVQLTTALAIIAGKTVIVDLGGTVSITGQGRIFTDNALFNIPNQGTITAGGGLITAPYIARPAF
jgi:hypothetical protein